MARLGVNVDHVATLRQQRRGPLPSPVWAAAVAQRSGCDRIVCHLREDRRHIQDEDLRSLRRLLRVPLNLEMSAHPEIVRIACRLKPAQATLVPERRQELTTEGGLELIRGRSRIGPVVRRLARAGIKVSLFIDPEPEQVRAACRLQVPLVEFHTGRYAAAFAGRERAGKKRALARLREAVQAARSGGLQVAAGHGLDYENVRAILQIPGIEELNIGFAIVARAMAVGFHQAVREMVELVHHEEQGKTGKAGRTGKTERPGG